MTVDERLLTELVRENAQLRDLLKSASDRMLALAAPMERTARASEEIQALTINEVREIRLAIQRIETNSALIAKDIDDVQRDVREVTGSHPTQLDVDDTTKTDQTIGKVVRSIAPVVVKIFPWLAAGALGLLRLIERWLPHHTH